MSFFGGSTSYIPEQPPKVLGYDSQRTSTHEAARPLPYMAGTNIFSLTWISDLYGITVTTTTTEVGKNSTVTESYYSVGFAGLGVHGPLDEISEIRFGGETVWEGSVERDGDDDVEITIESRGTAHVYWGTETQTPDADLEAGTGLEHPAYRGQFYIVFYVALTPGQTNIDNIEIVGRRNPDPSWMTASANLSGDANLGAVLGEYLQNKRFGLGYPDSKIDFVLLDAFANTLDVEDFGVSPYVSRETTIRQFIVEACEYVDGYPVVGRDGKIGFKLIRADDESSEESPESLIELGPDDIIGLPRDESIGWRDTFNQISVTFHDAAIAYSENEAVYHDDANFQITGEQKHERLERPWVTRMSVATRIAIGRGKVAGIPILRGSFTVRLSSLEGRDAGDRFTYNWPQLGISGITCRITKWRQDSPQRPQVTINYEEDLSYLSTEYFIPDVESPVSPDPLEPNAPDYQWVLDAPYGIMTDNSYKSILLFASRQGAEIGFTAWWRLPGWSAYLLFPLAPNKFSHFAMRGHLTADYAAETDLFDTVTMLSIEFDSNSNDIDDIEREQALENEWLVFVNDEILSILDSDLTGPGAYDLSTIRGRFDTVRGAHSENDEVWVIKRNFLAGLVTTGWISVDIDFKPRPFIASNQTDLDDITETTLTGWQGRYFLPGRPLNLKANGDGYNPTYSTGEDIDLTWTVGTQKRRDFSNFDDTGESYQFISFEIYDSGDVLDGTFLTLVNPGGSYTLQNAGLQSILGGEETFTIRAYGVRGGLKSFKYDEVKVHLV